jgi:hypothetical protein
MNKPTRSSILKLIGSDKLNLIKGVGYWYFVYDDMPIGVFDTYPVYTMYLKDMSIGHWVEIGKKFVNLYE